MSKFFSGFFKKTNSNTKELSGAAVPQTKPSIAPKESEINPIGEGLQGVVEFHTVENCRGDSRYGPQSAYDNQDRASSALIASNVSVADFFQESTAKIHQELKDEKYKGMGATICAAAYNPEEQVVTVANLGDSRAFLELENESGERILISLSQDFKPGVARFAQQIKEGGGEIEKDKKGVLRIKGEVSSDGTSRAVAVAGGFGDEDVKGLIRTPEILTWNLANISQTFAQIPDIAQFTKKTRIIICSDGFTDVKNKYGDIYTAIYELDKQGEENKFVKVEQQNTYKLKQDATAEEKTNRYSLANLTRISKRRVDNGKNDDISTIAFNFKDSEKIAPGENVMFCISDAHARDAQQHRGHEISQLITARMQQFAKSVVVGAATLSAQPSTAPHPAAALQLSGKDKSNVSEV